MYDDREIKKILRRAFELQNRAEGWLQSDESRHRLSQEEIEVIASESGLSPEYIKEAIIEFEGVPVEEPLFLDTGNSYEVEVLGYAEGELDKKLWTELRSLIEYHFDCPGKVKRRPGGIVWKAQPVGILKFLHTRKSPAVAVSSSARKTTIRLKKNLKTIHKLRYPAYAALAGALIILGISMMEGPEGLFFSAGLVVIAMLFHSWAGRKKEKARKTLKDIMEQLQTIITRRNRAAERRNLSREEPSVEIEQTPNDEESLSNTVSGGDRNETR